jgi:hypothetical protein
MVTLYVLSKVSYMNRVMMDVLPTASSPRNTSLYFERGMIGFFGPPPAAAALAAPFGLAVVAADAFAAVALVAADAVPPRPLLALAGGDEPDDIAQLRLCAAQERHEDVTPSL